MLLLWQGLFTVSEMGPNSLALEAFPISHSSEKVASCYTSQYVPGMEKKKTFVSHSPGFAILKIK